VGKLKAGLAIRALEWLEGVLRLFYRACIIFAQRSGAAGLDAGSSVVLFLGRSFEISLILGRRLKIES
jgi:hypothetical protein